jgi:AraC family transcriptional regulator
MEASLRCSLEYIRPVDVVSIRAHGPYARSVNEAWQRMFAWMDTNRLGAEINVGYGLAHDDPRMGTSEHCRYDACIAVPSGIAAAALDELSRQTLPSGVYARGRLTGSYDRMGSLLAGLRDDWAPRNGLVVDKHRPIVTVYINNPRFCPPAELAADICLPIVVDHSVAQPLRHNPATGRSCFALRDCASTASRIEHAHGQTGRHKTLPAGQHRRHDGV